LPGAAVCEKKIIAAPAAVFLVPLSPSRVAVDLVLSHGPLQPCRYLVVRDAVGHAHLVRPVDLSACRSPRPAPPADHEHPAFSPFDSALPAQNRCYPAPVDDPHLRVVCHADHVRLRRLAQACRIFDVQVLARVAAAEPGVTRLDRDSAPHLGCAGPGGYVRVAAARLGIPVASCHLLLQVNGVPDPVLWIADPVCPDPRRVRPERVKDFHAVATALAIHGLVLAASRLLLPGVAARLVFLYRAQLATVNYLTRVLPHLPAALDHPCPAPPVELLDRVRPPLDSPRQLMARCFPHGRQHGLEAERSSDFLF
jgi:hypothetical protein